MILQEEMTENLDTVPRAKALSVRPCASWEELDQFRDYWNRLLSENPLSSIFQTPEWLAAWWQAFGKGKKLLSLIFSDSDAKPVGIAPLYIEDQSFLGLSLKSLRFVGAGSGDSDALDFITIPGYERLCAEAFFKWLKTDAKWDICSLETL